MRSVIAIGAFAISLFLATAALAEKRIFVVANNADGYGIDRCLASGRSCGAAAAAAYCRSRQFVQAVSFRKVDRDDITGGVSARDCRDGSCEKFVAIECTR